MTAGDLVNVSNLGELLGFKVPIYMSRTAWNRVCKPASKPETTQTRAWDVLWALGQTCRETEHDAPKLPFAVETPDGPYALIALSVDMNRQNAIIIKAKKPNP